MKDIASFFKTLYQGLYFLYGLVDLHIYLYECKITGFPQILGNENGRGKVMGHEK